MQLDLSKLDHQTSSTIRAIDDEISKLESALALMRVAREACQQLIDGKMKPMLKQRVPGGPAVQERPASETITWHGNGPSPIEAARNVDAAEEG